MMNWKQLESESQLSEIDEISTIRPVVIFKHSTRCPVSFAALDRVELDSNELDDLDFEAYYLDLIQFRSISNELADKYGVTHQSPQVIVIKNGKAIYNNSHMGVNIGNIKKAIQ